MTQEARHRRSAFGLIGLALVFGACGSEGPVEPQPEPRPTFVSGRASANPHNTISAVVTVAAWCVIGARRNPGAPPNESS